MKTNRPTEEDTTDAAFRELFPPDEARLYARPEAWRLPTERVAYWSLAASALLAAALVVSWMRDRKEPPQRSGPGLRIDPQPQPAGAPPR